MNNIDNTTAVLAQLCDTTLWFWNLIKRSSSMDQLDGRMVISPKRRDHGDSALDRFNCERLRVSLAVLLITLCTSAMSTLSGDASNNAEAGAEPVSLSEFFNSDGSANEWTSCDHEGEEDVNKTVLRVIAQAVYCINHVFGSIKDVSAVSYSSIHITPHISLITVPCSLSLLIVTRCLGYLSVSLLMKFELAERNDESSNTSVSKSKYHHGTESIGNIVDSMLCKAYYVPVFTWFFLSGFKRNERCCNTIY
jgi:hypothetical protein